MRIVVTGGAGFIGSSFVHMLREYSKNHGHIDIIVVDKMTYASNHERVPDDVTLIMKDICDLTKKDVGEVDYIVNFAAESHVDNSIYDGTPFMYTNIMGVYNLIEVAKQMSDLKKFVQISTDEVYGDLEGCDGYSKEGDVLKPSSYYSSSKSAADQIVMSAGRTFDLPYLITRTCNNYGKHQHIEKFLPTIIECIREGIPVPLYGDGGQIREWIWVEDNVRIIFDLMISDIGIWNIGSGDRYTNKEILKIIGDLVGQPVKYNNVTDRLGHDRRYGLDCTKLHKFMGRDLTIINLVEYLETQLI